MRRNWTKQEEEKVKEMYKQGYSIKAICTVLKRSKGSVGSKIDQLRKTNYSKRKRLGT